MKLIPSSLFLLNKHIWPSCKKPKTLSFRASSSDDTMFKTVNSVYFDPKYTQQNEAEAEAETEMMTTPDSCFTNSSESASISTESEEYLNEYSSVETIVRGARSERLLFKPGPTTSSILEGKKQCMDLKLVGIGEEEEDEDRDDGNANGDIPYKESVVMAIESDDPHGDFKKSMEEMVESHGLKDWECLEELLGWYLRMNGKNHHELIVGAFVDLLAGISGGGSRRGNDETVDAGGGGGGGDGGASCSDQSIASFTSVASTFTSISYKGGDGEREIIEEEILLVNH